MEQISPLPSSPKEELYWFTHSLPTPIFRLIATCTVPHLLLQELRNFRVTMSVDPKYHPNIIGKKGVKINKIRESHDVRIQLPERDGSAADEITIMGYEHQVKAAEADILKIVQELVSACGGGWGFMFVDVCGWGGCVCGGVSVST